MVNHYNSMTEGEGGSVDFNKSNPNQPTQLVQLAVLL